MYPNMRRPELACISISERRRIKHIRQVIVTEFLCLMGVDIQKAAGQTETVQQGIVYGDLVPTGIHVSRALLGENLGV